MIIAVATVVSYVAGFFRDLIVSWSFGANSETDAFYASVTLVDNIYTITTAGALMGVLLPIFRRVYLEDREEGEKLMGAWMLLSQGFVLLVSILFFVFADPVVGWLYSDLVGGDRELVVLMSRILLLSPILFTISNSVGVVLHSFKHYLSFALSSSFYNVGIIFGLLMFRDSLGVMSLVVGTCIGLVMHMGIRLVDVFFVEEFKWRFALWHDGLKDVVRVALPKTFSLLAFQVALLIYNVVGVKLLEGSISAFNYARNIQGFAVSLFGVAVSTAVFPFLVDLIKKGDMNVVRLKVEDSILRVLIYCIPASVGLYFLSGDVVDVLFGRGAFDEAAVAMTASVLAFFALSITFESLNHLLIRVYNAFENTVWPLVGGTLFFGINLYMCFQVAIEGGVSVFGMAYGLGFLAQVVFLLLLLKKFLILDWRRLLKDGGRLLMSVVVMGAVVYGAKFSLLQGDYLGLFDFAFVVVLGALTYGIMIWILGVFRYTGFEHIIKKYLK